MAWLAGRGLGLEFEAVLTRLCRMNSVGFDMQVFGGWLRWRGSGWFVYTDSLALSQIYGWCEWFEILFLSSLRGAVIAILLYPLLVCDCCMGGALLSLSVFLIRVSCGGAVLSSLSPNALLGSLRPEDEMSVTAIGGFFSYGSTLLSSSNGNGSLISYVDGKAAPRFELYSNTKPKVRTNETTPNKGNRDIELVHSCYASRYPLQGVRESTGGRRRCVSCAGSSAVGDADGGA